MSRKNVTMTFPQRLKALEILKEHCSMDGDFAVYGDGHSDATIATLVSETCGFPCSPGGINGLRAQNIGKMRAAPWTKPNGGLLPGDAVIAALETRVADLERRLASLEGQLL